MADHPAGSNDFIGQYNDMLRRLRAVERESQLAGEGSETLQTFDRGTPLGETKLINFLGGATLVGDKHIEVGGDGKGGYAVLVAASDSPAHLKSRADFVCEGTSGPGDQVLINEILDGTKTGWVTETGWDEVAVVHLIPGIYHITDSILLVKSGTILRGSGSATNIVNLGAADPAIQIDVQSSYSAVEHLFLNNHFSAGTGNIGIRLGGDVCWATGINSGTGVGTYIGIAVDGVDCAVFDNRMNEPIAIRDTADSARVVDNFCASITVTQGAAPPASRHILADNDTRGITLTDVNRAQVQGNLFQNIVLDGCTYINVENNISAGAVGGSVVAGIYLLDTSDSSIQANIVRDTTLDGVRLAGDSNRNAIQSNQFRAVSAIEINIMAATCDDNLVCNNDNFGGTFTDSGTNTRKCGSDGGLPSGGVDIEDGGTPLGEADTLNFTGLGQSISLVGGTATLNVDGTVGVYDELVHIVEAKNLNFEGAGVSTVILGTDAATITIPGGGHVIEDEGTPLTQRANLSFVGAGVTVTDSAPDTIVTIAGGATFGSPVESQFGDTGADGVGTDAARDDHVHDRHDDAVLFYSGIN